MSETYEMEPPWYEDHERKRDAELARLKAELPEKLKQCVDQFQDMVGFQPGESRNALVCEIRDAVVAAARRLLSGEGEVKP